MIPANQERREAELALEAAIAQLPNWADEWNHLPAFKHFAGRLFDIAAETQFRNGTPDRGFLDRLVTHVVDAVLSEYAVPDEWWRFARKGSRFPLERRALREQLRQSLVRNRLLYWLRRYSLAAEAAGEIAPRTDTESAAQASVAQPESSTEAAARGATKKPRQHGFQANMDRHRTIAGVVERHVPDWRTSDRYREANMLKLICRDLDKEAADLMPESWKRGKTQALNGAPVKNWTEALEIATTGKKLVCDQIKLSLDAIRKAEVETP